MARIGNFFTEFKLPTRLPLLKRRFFYWIDFKIISFSSCKLFFQLKISFKKRFVFVFLGWTEVNVIWCIKKLIIQGADLEYVNDENNNAVMVNF
jgi:hypothetical protein